MQRLNHANHKIIVICIMLIVLLIGIALGIRLSGTTAGGDGLSILIFSLCFLTVVLLFITFIQVIHLHDDIAELRQEMQAKRTRR